MIGNAALLLLVPNPGPAPEGGWWMQLLLLVLAGALVAGLLYGGGLWRAAVLSSPFLSQEDKLQNKDAVVILTMSLVIVALSLYGVMAAALACFPGSRGALGLAVTWAAGGLGVGGIIGFLFGLPKIEEQQEEARKRRRRVIPSTSLDQINDWLTKAIVGVGLVEAQRIIAWGAKVAGRIGDGMAGAQSSTGAAFAAALLIAFPILGFITSYLVTRTFIALALARADVATSDAANQGAQSEQAVFQINDEEFAALDSAPLHLGEEMAPVDPRVDEAVEKIVSHPLDQLVSWKHIRLWAKAKLLSALRAEGEEAKALATEAEKGYAKAIGLVPNDAETRLGMAVAMTEREASKREILKQLETAKDCLMAKADADLRKNVFKSLTYRYLYLPEPESFQRTIEAAREYFAKPGAISSGGMWVNVACAYGLALKWLAEDETRSLDIKEFGVGQIGGPAPQQNAARDSVMAWLRVAAVKASREALSRDEKWKSRLRCLAGLDPNFAEEADLLPVQGELRQLLEP